MPALTKKDLREHFPQGVLPGDRNLEQALQRGEVSLVETSGTTDDRVTNIWNQPWWDASERASWQLNSWMAKTATGEHREAILVNPKNVGLLSDERDLSMKERRLSHFLYLNEKSDPLAWTAELQQRMLKELSEFRPAVLEANPSYLARLARYIQSAGETVYQPEAIVFTYEYPSLLHQRQIRRVFKCPLISSYGTTETGYVFMQCEKGKLHQNCDFARVDLQPFKEEHGGPRLGRLLVTPLQNPWSYFVRFDTGDIAQLASSGRCDCGRSEGLILEKIAGRKVNLTLTCTNRLVTLAELDETLNRLSGLEQFKLEQADRENYNLTLVSVRADQKQLSAETTAALKALYGEQAKINIIYAKDIEPEISGKYLLARALFPIEIEEFLVK